MQQGIEYLIGLWPGFASVFEVIYGLATEVKSWRAAVQAVASLYDEGLISLNQNISSEKEVTMAETGRYQYSVSLTLVDADPAQCLNMLIRHLNDPDLVRELGKYKVVEGTPICGITEFDRFALSPAELDRLCEGLNGVVMRSLLTGVISDSEKKTEEMKRTIERLKSQLEDSADYNKQLVPKSVGYVGKVILACARNIIGEQKSLRMSDTKLTETLIEMLPTESGDRIATPKGLLPYIQAGLAKEHV